jgi:hypothetical protein
MEEMPRKTKRACPKGCKKAKRRKRKKSRWQKHVMAEFRRNKSGGFSAVLRRAKKTYKK